MIALLGFLGFVSLFVLVGRLCLLRRLYFAFDFLLRGTFTFSKVFFSLFLIHELVCVPDVCGSSDDGCRY